jgi:hypothetical protein
MELTVEEELVAHLFLEADERCRNPTVNYWPGITIACC